MVTAGAKLTLHVQPNSDDDLEELTKVIMRLRAKLLELDVEKVIPVTESTIPNNAKGIASLAGALIVHLGTLNGLRSVVDAVRNWTSRTNRTIEVSIGGDVLKLTGVTSQQQEKIIDVWISRHAPDS